MKMGKHLKNKQLILFVLLSLFWSVNSYAQEQTVTVDVKNASLREVFGIIERQTTYRFSYRDAIFDNRKDITISKKRSSVNLVLNEVLKGRNLEYKIVSPKLIVISYKETEHLRRTEKNDVKSKGRKNISGVIKDASGQPIIGASVVVKGTTIGTVTDIEGKFNLEVPNDGFLSISYIGYEKQDLSINNKFSFDIVLKENSKILSDVVVTALGITREKKGLGYATQQIKEEALENKSSNLVSMLSGKVAGMSINTGAVAGGGTRISLRGDRALDAGPSSPLFVIDGVPIGSGAGSQTGSSEINEISPNDIENINVLKGAAASALYGSAAANGAIIITTKRGGKAKGLNISYSSTFSQETPLKLPKLQNQFGQGKNGIYVGGNFGSSSGYYSPGTNDTYDESWGPRFMGQSMILFDSPTTNGYRAGDTYLSPEIRGEVIPSKWVAHPNNIKDFFAHGNTSINSIALSSSTQGMDFRFGYTRTTQNGLTPNNNISRHSFNLNNSIKINKWISADAVVNYIKTDRTNVPTLGYGGVSPMYFFCWMPQSHNINSLKEYWQRGGLKGTRQFQNMAQYNNPYFVQHEMVSNSETYRFFGKFSVEIKPINELSIMLRGGTDNSWDNDSRKESYYKNGGNGYYSNGQSQTHNNNYDFLINYMPQIGKNFSLTANFGGNRMESFYKGISAYTNSLIVPNIYSFDNSKEKPTVSDSRSKKVVNSLYGSILMDYKRMVFAEITGRNDWSSTLPLSTDSYFYPSVTLSGLISEMVKLPSYISYAKVRCSYASVGNDTGPYNLYNTYYLNDYWNGVPTLSSPNSLLNNNLKPAMSQSWEAGAELNLFKNRLNFDFSYYHTITKDQIISLQTANTSAYNSRLINSGKTANSGIELVVNATPLLLSNGLKWNININFSRSRTKVISLAEGLDELTLTSTSLEDAKIVARPGKRMGQLYGTAYDRVTDGQLKGQPILNSAGQYVSKSDVYLGNVNPDWTAGISSSLYFKGFDLNILFDTRHGGYFVSRTMNKFAGAGQTIESLEGRGARKPGTEYNDLYYSEGAISVNGEWQQNLQIFDGTYSKGIAGNDVRRFIKTKYDHITEAQLADASYVKLRELRLGYTLPINLAKKVYMQNVNIAFFGRDLFLWTKNPHVDPESGGMSDFHFGVDAFSVPSSRSLGFQINVNF
jgi:TonB-linked SusC/RagA family outer membrane protein